MLDKKGITKKKEWNKWTAEENEAFALAVKQYGKDFDKITEALKTRSRKSVINHCSYVPVAKKNLKDATLN